MGMILFWHDYKVGSIFDVLKQRNRAILSFSRAKRLFFSDMRASPAFYKALFEAENEDVDIGNTFFRDVKDE